MPSLRRWRRRLARGLAQAVAGRAGAGGVKRLRHTGRLVGRLHYWLTWPARGRLRADIARVLGVTRRRAGAILAAAFRDNDRAVVEILAQADPRCDIDALLADIEIEDRHHLHAARENSSGVIVLGMHMGNGIAMAGRLARDGLPVHVVFRDPRRLEPGTLARSIERVGCVPVALDRDNPTRSFRRMLQILRAGGVLYVLMDQANKRDGAERSFLGKRLRLPTGIPGLAVRTGTPVVPVHAEAAEPGWRFRVHPPLAGDDPDALLDAICASMEAQIRRFPALWAWHHRRWRRYHFESVPRPPE